MGVRLQLLSGLWHVFQAHPRVRSALFFAFLVVHLAVQRDPSFPACQPLSSLFFALGQLVSLAGGIADRGAVSGRCGLGAEVAIPMLTKSPLSLTCGPLRRPLQTLYLI